VTGNPTIDHWIAEGRLAPQAVPGTILDLLPLPAPRARIDESVISP
jgi:hypothetical protein